MSSTKQLQAWLFAKQRRQQQQQQPQPQQHKHYYYQQQCGYNRLMNVKKFSCPKFGTGSVAVATVATTAAIMAATSVYHHQQEEEQNRQQFQKQKVNEKIMDTENIYHNSNYIATNNNGNDNNDKDNNLFAWKQASKPSHYFLSPSFPTPIHSTNCAWFATKPIPPDNENSNNSVKKTKFKLSRSQTLIRMEQTKSSESLESKYNLDAKAGALGEGGFGSVFKAQNKETGEWVAVKKIPKRYTDNVNFQREMNALMHIRGEGGHPHICGLRDHYEEGDFYYIVLDLVSGGEMFDHLCSQGPYSEADAARLVREVASALAFLHGIGCTHGDLKPENLMLSTEQSSDAVIKLVDFGCAKVTDPDSPYYDKESLFMAANTPGYSPPEVVDKVRLKQLRNSDNQKKLSLLSDPAIDMWALGVILYIMLTGIHPFDLSGTSTDDEMNQQVLSKKGPPLRNSPITAHLSTSAIDLIEKLIRTDPKRRISAHQMLNHPWVRGETARKGKMAHSDKRLEAAHRVLKTRLQAQVFANMIGFTDDSENNSVAKRTSLLERSFKMLDPEHRGYITTEQLQKLTKTNDSDKDSSPLSSSFDKTDEMLSLSGFSDLLAENMKNRYFPAGHVVYREGEKGHKMYFINSGRVQVSTKEGFQAITEQGDFFGEGALLHPNALRSATIRCVTPVHAIEISREYFEKYMADGYDVQLNLREKDKSRKRQRAKTILTLQQNMFIKHVNAGEFLFEMGQDGLELYILEEGSVDVLVKNHSVFTIQPGEMCGEHSLIFGRPRNTSAKCVSGGGCKVHVLRASDFYKLMDTHPSVKESLRDICLRREFQKALVFTIQKAFPKNEQELLEAFDKADYNRSGKIDLSDIRHMLKRMDTTFSEDDIKAILTSLDLDKSGSINFQEFKRIFGMSPKSDKKRPTTTEGNK